MTKIHLRLVYNNFWLRLSLICSKFQIFKIEKCCGRGDDYINMEKKLFDILDKFDTNIDLYLEYPIDFMYQLENVLDILFNNYNFNFKDNYFM
jgi:hypothetical protein